MKEDRFLWSAHRITERQKAGKARSIKGKQLKNSRNTVSRQLVEHHSSLNVNLGYARDNQKRISKCLQTLETPYVSGVFHFSGNIVECRETG